MRNGFRRPPRTDRLASHTRRGKPPVDWPPEEPATPGPTQQTVDIATPNRLKQLQRLAQTVETKGEQDHFFLPKARLAYDRFVPASSTGQSLTNLCSLCFSVPIVDETVRARTEPGTPPPRQLPLSGLGPI
ncbi:MAG: hypothetical protein PVSMB9_07080 [Candidatus Dormibacteria bacterium]